MKKLVGLLLLLVLLVVVDRGAAAYAGRSLATQLQRSGGLTAEPTVTVGGFPFLTQAARGRYDRIEVVATEVPAGETRFARLDAVLTGVRVPLSQVLAGAVTEVPVDGVDARALLSYDALSRSSGGRRLTAEAAGDRVRVRGEVDVLGQRLGAAAVSTVALEGDDVVVTAQSFEVGNGVADALLTIALRGRLDLRLSVRDLPYGLAVDAVTVDPAGVLIRATARDTVLTAR